MDVSPCYCFDASEDKWNGLNVENVIADALYDWFDGAGEHINNYDELEAFIEQWNAKQILCQYFLNEKKIIVLDENRFNVLIK